MVAPLAASSRPRVPTVVTVSGNGKRSVVSRVFVAFAKIALTEAQVAAKSLARTLVLIQENIDAATLPARSSPLSQFTIAEMVQMTSGSNVVIRHGLGVAFQWYEPLRAYNQPQVAAASDPFAAFDAPSNGGLDPTQYLVLQAASTGFYDICVYGS